MAATIALRYPDIAIAMAANKQDLNSPLAAHVERGCFGPGQAPRLSVARADDGHV